MKRNERVVASCPPPIIEHRSIDAKNILQFNYENVSKPSKNLDAPSPSNLLESRQERNDTNTRHAKDKLFQFSVMQVNDAPQTIIEILNMYVCGISYSFSA